MAGSKAQSGASRDPTPVGRDPHPGGQRPSPSRAPTRTSRRAGIDQGDLLHTKVTTSSLRMQGDHKEQHSSHSLNQWKERFDLWHRHAGMLTRGEPYKLIGILNKEPRSLMTWFGPSPERGPGTQPTKNSTWVFSSINVTTMYSIEFPVTVRIYYSVSIDRAVAQYYIYYKECSSSYVLHPMCSIKRWTDLWSGQWPNVSYSVQSKGRQFLVTGQWP